MQYGNHKPKGNEMDYLSEEISIYQCQTCLAAGEKHFWVDDPHVGLFCAECDKEVKYSHSRPATWWSVGVYEIERVYGGPKKGGRFYTTGNIIKEWLVRGFQDMDEANNYRYELDEMMKHKDNIDVRCFTEKLPYRRFSE